MPMRITKGSRWNEKHYYARKLLELAYQNPDEYFTSSKDVFTWLYATSIRGKYIDTVGTGPLFRINSGGNVFVVEPSENWCNSCKKYFTAGTLTLYQEKSKYSRDYNLSMGGEKIKFKKMSRINYSEYLLPAKSREGRLDGWFCKECFGSKDVFGRDLTSLLSDSPEHSRIKELFQ